VSLPAELMSAARTAPFVFLGTVRRPGGSNVEALDVEAEPTAIVRVDEVISAPEAVGDLAGREITLRLSEAGDLSRGSRHMFMATSLHFGDEIAVAEIARMPHRRAAEAELRRAVLEEKLREQDRALGERLRRAALVIYGRVEEIEPVVTESTGVAEPLGEAAPGWRAAVLLVWRALKGRPVEEPRVVFPFPRTQKWSEVPLFVEGQEGVWVLQSAPDQTLAGGRVRVPSVPRGFTALDPLDFHAPGLLSRIELLLSSPEPPRRGRRR
jgi:hypothetical protein